MSGKVADAKCLAHSRYSVSYWFGGRGWGVWFGFGGVLFCFCFLGIFAFLEAELRATKKHFLYTLKSCFLGAVGGVRI